MELIVFGVFALAVVGFIYLLDRAHQRDIAELTDVFLAQYHSLASRIQRPELIPPVDPAAPQPPDEDLFTAEPDEIGLVGTIDTGNPAHDGNG